MSKRAALYARVSTNQQEEEGTSLETQVEAMLVFAQQKRYDAPPDLIFEESWPGVILQRPTLDRLRAIVRAGEIDALITYSTDRLARNPIHIAIIAEECEKHGVELLFVTEPLDNSPEGYLIRYIKGYAAQVEHEKIKDRTMRGKIARARQGKLPTGGGRLYGYDYDPEKGVRVINEKEARVVQMVFRWLVEEKLTLGRICMGLVDMGIPAPKGGKMWSTGTMFRLLRHRDYTGETYANYMRSVEPKTHVRPDRKYPYRKTQREIRPREEWIELPNATPPIISKELFEAAQRQLEINRKNAKRNRKRTYLLRGHVRCGKCGRAMYGEPNGKYRYHRCSGRRGTVAITRCHNSANAGLLEEAIWAKIKELLMNPDLIMAELQRWESTGEGDSAEVDLEVVMSKLAELRLEEKRILKLYRKGSIDEGVLDAELKDIAKERTGWEAEKERLCKRIEAKKHVVEKRATLEEYCRAISRGLECVTEGDKREIIEELEIVVTYAEGKAVLTGIITPGEEVGMMPAKEKVGLDSDDG